MKNNTKKWLLVIGCLAICAVLVWLISTRMANEPPLDKPIPSQSAQPSHVTVTPPATEKEKDVVVIPPEIPKEQTSTNNGAVSSGNNQTIQPDPVKPEYTENQLKDDTQTPDGKPVTTPPPAVDHDKVGQPKETPPTTPPSKPSGGNSIPGFDNVPDGGPNQVIEVDGDGDINKQVGTMG